MNLKKTILKKIAPQFFRRLNLLNPTSFGRYFIADFAKRIGAIPEDGDYKVSDGVFLSLQMHDYIDRSIFFDSFEHQCRSIILNFLKPGSVFLDIGANIGYYSLLASRRVGEKGRVIAFEPNPITVKRIQKNIVLSGASNIELFDFALSNKEDVVELYCPTSETHGYTSMRNHGWENVDCYKVSTKKLDDSLPTNLTRIDLIKIDVEGAEMLAFEGAREVIKNFKPPILMELNEKASENFGYDTLDVVKLLVSLNNDYRLKYIGEHSVVSITLEKLFSEAKRNGGLLLY